MKKFFQSIDRLNNFVGEKFSWLLAVMAVVTFLIVVLRYAFNLGWVWLQEVVVYSHALLFLSTAAYAYLKGAHVRVDIFHQAGSAKFKKRVEILGVVLFLIPICLLVFVTSLPYVLNSWSVFEGSKDGGGIEAVFILKTFIPLFAILLFLQGISQLYKALKGNKQ